jgi:phage terminase large subunit-like protein
LRDLQEAHARGLHWDVAAAQRAIRFFSTVLKLVGGQFEGRPFILEPSQEFQVGSLFGWLREDGARRFRRAYIEEGKGNGKSPLAAGIGLYGLIADKEPRAEIYAAATKRDQAMVLFRDAVAMVDQSPPLARRITKTGITQVYNLSDLRTGSFFRPISSDDSQSGPRPHFALCDELHEHKNRTHVDILERGFKFRRQPLLLMITNSGTDRNSLCWEEHEHAVNVAAGLVEDDSTFSYVCALDEGDDPLTDPSCWPKANPLINVTLTHDYLAGVVAQAKALPGKTNGIKRLHFCMWTQAEEAWMSPDALMAVLKEFDPLEHEGEPICVGVDLSATQDLTALAFVVKTGDVQRERRAPDGKAAELVTLPTFDAWIMAFTPRETVAERSLRDKAPYDVWVNQGFLNDTPGKIIRLDFIAAALRDAATTFVITVCAYDRYAFRKFEDECDELGLSIPFVEHPQGGKRRAPPTDEQVEEAKLNDEEPPQGLWMPQSVKELELLILEERIRIRTSPVIISAFMSAVLESDALDNRWFSKRKAVNRIDPLVALTMAVGAATSDLARTERSDIGDFLANALMA